MSAFHAGLPAARVHASLQKSLEELCRAEKCAVLWFTEILNRQLFRELGYSSIHQYATEALGFSSSRTYQFIRLAKSMTDLPALKESVARGEIGWTKAREIAKVATPGTEKMWLEEAKNMGRRELEQKVVRVRRRAAAARKVDPRQGSLDVDTESVTEGELGTETTLAEQIAAAGLPVTVNFHFRPEQRARYEAMLEKIHKARLVPPGTSREEILLAAMAELLLSSGPRGNNGQPHCGEEQNCTRVHSAPPYQIVIYKCKLCGGAEVHTHAGDRRLSSHTLAAVECDAQVLEPGKRNRAIVPPATRRAVFARDGHRCQAPGCNNTRFLEVHHLIPRTNGGNNKLDNLCTLCSSCHYLWHERGMAGEFLKPGMPGKPGKPDKPSKPGKPNKSKKSEMSRGPGGR